MIKYMKKYEQSKNIKFKNVKFDHKLRSSSLIETVFNLIVWSSFHEIYLSISYQKISNCIWTTFSKIIKLPTPNVQKVIISNRNALDYFDWENPSSKNIITVILVEYGVNYHTYVLYKFLENSRMLDSIKEIEFDDSIGIDYSYLESLIVKYQSKHNMQLGISFKLRANLNIFSPAKIIKYFYSMVSYLIPIANIIKLDNIWLL